MRKLRLEELGRPTPEEYTQQEKLQVVVVLDNIRSGMNTGSIFRSCDGFGVERLILCGITPVPPHKEIHKTAIGAHQTVPWEHHENVVEAIQSLKSDGFSIYAIEQTTDSQVLARFSFEMTQKCAVIFGNEVDGVSNEILPLIDYAIELDQFGTKHSLNVAVCAGIVLWKLSKEMRAK